MEGGGEGSVEETGSVIRLSENNKVFVILKLFGVILRRMGGGGGGGLDGYGQIKGT